MPINESTAELAALHWLAELGYATLPGTAITDERGSFRDIVLVPRLRAAIERLNPDATHEAREEALRAVVRVVQPDLVAENRRLHRLPA